MSYPEGTPEIRPTATIGDREYTQAMQSIRNAGIMPPDVARTHALLDAIAAKSGAITGPKVQHGKPEPQAKNIPQ